MLFKKACIIPDAELAEAMKGQRFDRLNDQKALN